jgi:nucleoside recognition membrane protein YjiH
MEAAAVSTTTGNSTVNDTTTASPRGLGTLPGRVAVAATASYWALSIAVVIANPQWNPLTRQLSEYALGQAGGLQIAAFLATAVA